MQFSYKYRLTADEYRDYNYYMMTGTKNARDTQRLALAIGVFVAVVKLFGAIRDGDSGDIISGAVLVLLFPTILWLICRFLIPKMAMKQVDSAIARNPSGVLAESELTFFEDRASDVSPDSRIEVAYHRFRSVSVTKKGDIYLWLSGDTAMIVPSRVFSGDDERRAFLGMLAAKPGMIINDQYYR